MLNASSTPQLPRSTRKLELSGLARMLAPSLPDRVVVAGAPQAGKSLLAKAIAGAHAVRETDTLKGLEWSQASLEASHWLDEPGPWICEGVAMARALRKWLARNPEGSPADLVVAIHDPVIARSRGQHVMAAGCVTVWQQILPELLSRGTRIVEM